MLVEPFERPSLLRSLSVLERLLATEGFVAPDDDAISSTVHQSDEFVSN